MAFKIMYMDGNGDWHDEDGVLIEYYCDEEADVADLPTGEGETDWRKKPRPGSRAIVAETCDVYTLKTTRTWIKLT